MAEVKAVSLPFTAYFKLSSDQSPKDEEEKREMDHIPYSSAVGSIMYSMVCTCPNLAHGMSVISRFMANPGKTHWMAVKWMLRYIKGSIRNALNLWWS